MYQGRKKEFSSWEHNLKTKTYSVLADHGLKFKE
jgi:hypothetical protein